MAEYACLRRLCEARGISGDESAVRAVILEEIRPFCDEITITPLGGILARKKGKSPAARRVMIDAHMDEVGLIVTHISEEGFLSFGCVGGIDRRVLPGCRVWIGEKPVPGTILVRPVHLVEKENSGRVPPVEEMVIDIGAASREEAFQAVQPGDSVTFASFFEAGHGAIKSRALDDRAGCAALIEILRQELPFDITVSFSVQEEVGLMGAGTTAFLTRPEVALVLEATTAADIPGVDEPRRVCRVGQGPVLSFMDRNTVYDKALLSLAERTAQQAGIPIQYKQAVAGGNNAGSIHRSAGGVRTLALSLACRYLHAPVSLISEKDYGDYIRLAQRLAEVLPAGEET